MNEFSKADKYGRDKVKDRLLSLFENNLNNVDLYYCEDDTSRSDIFVSGWSNNDKLITYCIECKDRKFEHTKYDNDKMEDEERGYIIEQPKKEYLITQSQYGMIPLYVNSFSDNYMAVWNLNKINWDNSGTTGEKTFETTTVKKGKLYQDNKQTLKLEQAQWTGSIY